MMFSSKILLMFLFFPLVAIFIYFLTDVPGNNLLFLTNLLVLFLSFIGMFLDLGKKYTLSKMVFVFVFFFFGVVPLNDELNKNLYWGGQEIDVFFKIVTN